jgi:Resolvase, N terminal domain
MFEHGRQRLLLMVDSGENEVGQAKVGRHSDFLSDQHIDAAPKDEAWFELRTHHPSNLLLKKSPCGDVKGTEASVQLANQEDLGRVQFVEERMSGKVPWRKRRTADLLETLQAKDNLIVSELSRLGRSMLE